MKKSGGLKASEDDQPKKKRSVPATKSAGDVGRKMASNIIAPVKRKMKASTTEDHHHNDHSDADHHEDKSTASEGGSPDKKKSGSERGRWRFSLEPKSNQPSSTSTAEVNLSTSTGAAPTSKKEKQKAKKAAAAKEEEERAKKIKDDVVKEGEVAKKVKQQEALAKRLYEEMMALKRHKEKKERKEKHGEERRPTDETGHESTILPRGDTTETNREEAEDQVEGTDARLECERNEKQKEEENEIKKEEVQEKHTPPVAPLPEVPAAGESKPQAGEIEAKSEEPASQEATKEEDKKEDPKEEEKKGEEPLQQTESTTEDDGKQQQEQQPQTPTATTTEATTPKQEEQMTEEEAEKRKAIIEERKKRLLNLHKLDGNEGAAGPLSGLELGALDGTSSLRAGMLAARNNNRRKRRNTLDLSQPKSESTTMNPEGKSKRLSAETKLALPFLPMNRMMDGGLLTPISELTPTSEQAFRREKQRKLGSSKEDDGVATVRKNGKKRSSIVVSAQTSPILQALADAHFSDQDIWEGAPKMFSLLREYKDALLSGAGGATNIVNFLFPRGAPEFNGSVSKTYKIKNNQPINKLLASIMKRVAPTQAASRYTLCTLGGYLLDDKEQLSSYGLGSLLESWELKVVAKIQAPKRAIPPRPTAALPSVPAGFAEEKGIKLEENSKKLEKRVQNSELQQGELESKIAALSLRLEQQLEEKERKIGDLTIQLREKEEAAQKAQAEMKELISEREVLVKAEVTNSLLSQAEQNVEEKLKNILEELENVKKNTAEEKERQEEFVRKLKDEVQRSQEQLKEMARQNKELKTELEKMPEQLLQAAGSELQRKVEEEKKGTVGEEKAEEKESISFEKFEDELGAVRKEFENKQQDMLLKLKESFDAEKKELRFLFKENERKLKEENESLKRTLEERELKTKEERKALNKAHAKLEEMMAKMEKRMDEETKAELGRLTNAVSELKLGADIERNEQAKRLAIVSENVESLSESLMAATRTIEGADARFRALEEKMIGLVQQQQQQQQHSRQELQLNGILPPPPPPKSATGSEESEDESEGECEGRRIAPFTLEEQIMAISLRKTAPVDESERKKTLASSSPSLGEHASLLFSGLQKRFSNIQTIEKIEELEELSEDDISDDEEDDF